MALKTLVLLVTALGLGWIISGELNAPKGRRRKAKNPFFGRRRTRETTGVWDTKKNVEEDEDEDEEPLDDCDRVWEAVQLGLPTNAKDTSGGEGSPPGRGDSRFNTPKKAHKEKSGGGAADSADGHSADEVVEDAEGAGEQPGGAAVAHGHDGSEPSVDILSDAAMPATPSRVGHRDAIFGDGSSAAADSEADSKLGVDGSPASADSNSSAGSVRKITIRKSTHTTQIIRTENGSAHPARARRDSEVFYNLLDMYKDNSRTSEDSKPSPAGSSASPAVFCREPLHQIGSPRRQQQQQQDENEDDEDVQQQGQQQQREGADPSAMPRAATEGDPIGSAWDAEHASRPRHMRSQSDAGVSLRARRILFDQDQDHHASLFA